MSDFSDRPFVAGSLTGLRAFSVDKYGRLVGPSYGSVFTPGENEADCNNTSRIVNGITATGAGEIEITSGGPFNSYNYYTVTSTDGSVRQFHDPRTFAEAFPPRDEHTVGEAGCSCGYYAYFDGQNDYAKTNRVTAVIEGYGVCTIGGRGFRASKARLLALVNPALSTSPEVAIPEPTRPSLWARVQPWSTALLVAVNTTLAIRAGVNGAWAYMVLHASLGFMLLVGTVVVSLLKRRNEADLLQMYEAVAGKPPSTLDWRLIERNYPEVPVYPTVEAALAAHPLTPPPDPTPDDEDFWTRPVMSR